MDEGIQLKALEVLKKLGWHDGDQWFTEREEKKLADMGYHVSEAARKFLKRFGFVQWSEKSPYQNAYDLCHTNPVRAGNVCHPNEIAQWEEQVGAQLCPIGEVGYGSFLLTMDEHGRAFGANQELVLSFFADDGLELVDMLFGTGGGPKWIVDEQDCWTEGPASGDRA